MTSTLHKVALVAATLLAPGRSGSETLVVSDASQIQYAVGPDSYVFLRNLDQFGTGWLGCCENYKINLATDAGKAQFSALLSAALSHTPISIYVGAKGAPNFVLQISKF